MTEDMTVIGREDIEAMIDKFQADDAFRGIDNPDPRRKQEFCGHVGRRLPLGECPLCGVLDAELAELLTDLLAFDD
jgi:hypothetical protein